MTRSERVLFICKKRLSNYKNSVGLVNSAALVARKLEENGIAAKVVIVDDANGIDKEVFLFRPTHVVIEAVWVTTDKFKVLLEKHPKKKWIVRLHSRAPFLANEGIVFTRLVEYRDELVKKYKNFVISFNNEEFNNDLNEVINLKAIYLPNIYDPDYFSDPTYYQRQVGRKIDVGCFGAIRPMKNTFNQAIAAIKYADKYKKILRFHVNAGRVEQSGENNLKNLKALFEGTNKHFLIEHEWYDHTNFLELVDSMDLCMQVSFSETFNIVSADAVSQHVPVVVSSEVNWVPVSFHADPNSTDSMVNAIEHALYWGYFGTWLNMRALKRNCNKATDTWLDFIK